MATFVLTYRAPKHYDGGGPDVAIQWQEYLESVGTNMVDAGNPVFMRRVIGADPGETDLAGYSIIDADDLDAACDFAKGVPFLKIGGAVEVGEITNLNILSVVTPAEDHAEATGMTR